VAPTVVVGALTLHLFGSNSGSGRRRHRGAADQPDAGRIGVGVGGAKSRERQSARCLRRPDGPPSCRSCNPSTGGRRRWALPLQRPLGRLV
jgi:hypothetical protein